MFYYDENLEDFCADYLEEAIKDINCKSHAQSLKKLLKKIEKQEIPEVDFELLREILSEEWSDGLIPKNLPSDILKRTIKEHYYFMKHPYSEKNNTIWAFILILNNMEKMDNSEDSFELSAIEMLDCQVPQFLDSLV